MLCPLIPFESSLSFTHLVREDTLVSEQETARGGGQISGAGVQVWYKFGTSLVLVWFVQPLNVPTLSASVVSTGVYGVGGGVRRQFHLVSVSRVCYCEHNTELLERTG